MMDQRSHTDFLCGLRALVPRRSLDLYNFQNHLVAGIIFLFFSLDCFVLVEYWVQFVKMGVNRVLHEKETENRIKARRMVESMEKKSKQNTSFIVVILLHEQLSSWLQNIQS